MRLHRLVSAWSSCDRDIDIVLTCSFPVSLDRLYPIRGLFLKSYPLRGSLIVISADAGK